MQFKSKKPRPPTGMEMTATLFMPADQTAQQSSESLIKFFEAVLRASKEVGSSWIRVNCCNIPAELEAALQFAHHKHERRPNLTLVIDNEATP